MVITDDQVLSSWLARIRQRDMLGVGLGMSPVGKSTCSVD